MLGKPSLSPYSTGFILKLYFSLGFHSTAHNVYQAACALLGWCQTGKVAALLRKNAHVFTMKLCTSQENRSKWAVIPGMYSWNSTVHDPITCLSKDPYPVSGAMRWDFVQSCQIGFLLFECRCTKKKNSTQEIFGFEVFKQ